LSLHDALGLADGTTLFESLAITVFLTSAHADKGLAPLPGTAAHGEYLSWLTFMSVNIYGAINLAFHGDAYTRDDAGFAFMKQKAVAESNRLFGMVEKRLAVGGPFVLGADFSAADLYLFMLTIWAKPSQAELLAQNPHIAKVCAHVRGMGSLRAALEAHGVL
jgi:glutathione S-transferase